MTEFVFDGPAGAGWTIALAHGAGAPMDSPFMEHVANRLAEAGLRVARFEFPYMAGRRRDGLRRGPDRAPVLIETWHSVIGALGPQRLVIGGKSMGGRIASMVADSAGVSGLVCLGYPFHPPGKPERTRTDHLAALRTPALICQGERDPFGTPDEVAGYRLATSIRVFWLADGDHSFKPRKKSGRTEGQNWDDAAAAIRGFVAGLGA
ncbi:MAG: alpha/beta hydrolase [Alphaproteobacteria bacterium]|nr:alpha/beta hydrolase [Alphaproteobacteria bacterium]